MKRKQIVKIERTLMRFQDGDLYTPVELDGVGVYHAIAKRLETLRLTMLNLADSEVEFSRRTNKSIAAVAHDMKTPLSIISGYAECISDGMDDKDYPALILQKTQQMNDMVIALVESSHQQLEKEGAHKFLHDSRVLFGKIMEKVRPLAESKNIKLKVGKIPSERIRADEQQMERVMQNLVSNAVKYSPEGSTVKVRFHRWGKKLVICVQDHGIGISKESQPLIFDQFYTEDKSRSSGNSQGVGLYVVKGIVSEHGGTIYVSSKKGKGSTFYVQLPVEPALNEKISYTGRFDRRPLWQKILWEFFMGWAFASVYRVAKFFETRCISTLIAGILCIGLFPFIWLVDFMSIVVYGRITFLAD